MKRMVLFFLALGLGSSEQAHGTEAGYLLFNNRITGMVVAPIFGPDPAQPCLMRQGNPPQPGFPAGTQNYGGEPLQGPTYSADLFVGRIDATEERLMPVATTTFRTGAAAGFVNGLSVPLPGIPPGERVRFQIRAYDNQGGTLSSYFQAVCQGSLTGRSVMVDSQPLGSSSNPTPLIGLTSFNIAGCGAGGSFHVQPSSATNLLHSGETAILRAVANMGRPVTFEWRFNGLPISNTNSFLVLTNVQSAHSGDYTVTVSDGQSVCGPRSVRLSVASFSTHLETEHRPLDPLLRGAIIGLPNRAYQLLNSTNLSHWNVWTGLVADSNGNARFSVPIQRSSTGSFYRAVLVPIN